MSLVLLVTFGASAADASLPVSGDSAIDRPSVLFIGIMGIENDNYGKDLRIMPLFVAASRKQSRNSPC